MSTPTLVGVPAPRGGYTARYLHHGDHSAGLVPVLRRIWTDTVGRDTAALTAALLTRDWSGLTTTGAPGRHRPRPIPRLGHPPRPARPARGTGR